MKVLVCYEQGYRLQNTTYKLKANITKVIDVKTPDDIYPTVSNLNELPPFPAGENYSYEKFSIQSQKVSPNFSPNFSFYETVNYKNLLWYFPQCRTALW